MTTRLALTWLCVAVVCVGGAAFYVHTGAAPACDSDRAQAQVSRVLRDRFNLQSVFLHDFTTLAGNYFSSSRDCTAEIAQIRGDVDAADLKWRQIRYRVVHSDVSERPDVSVDLGGATAFVPPPEQTFWTRLFVHF